MDFIAGKRCRFDRVYAAGEIVPAEVVDPKRVKALVSYGVLRMQKASEPVVTEQNQTAPVKTEPKPAQKVAPIREKPKTTRKRAVK